MDAIALASRGNVRARSRLAAMRKHSREEDADLALLRERKMPLEPPEDHR
jgi:hypothetical protein